MIYASFFGVCNPDDSTLESYNASATDLAGSGFATVNLWQFHVDAAGNLLFNAAAPGPALISGGALQSGFSYVPGVFAALTASASKVTKVRATIGGWGLDNTFNNMVQLINQFGTGPANPLYQNFVALKALGVTGIDLDLEPSGGKVIHDYPYYIGPLAQLITMIAGLGLGTTFCPYQNENFWLVLLAAVYTQNGGQQPVKSMNVQCYSGGAGNTQTAWIDVLNQFPDLQTGMATTASEALGISDPASFVVPGLGLMLSGQPQCPSALQQALTAKGFAQKGITGAYLFNYANIQSIQQSGSCPNDNTTADYANAIIAGINAVNGAS
jgi:hypothetical protein